ncbi:LysR substrate-binding domain-containing protein [Budvicia aquatica]|uniref:LysR substrate-binding domain-containing protein n=1 Tax=Budvicia aquatica TaxID=82979 RepID=UPI002081D0D6|nr:LysR substrate-binding domain-containing protein [Budvicia aquatica]GKX49873.1 LysR family transcriptional regulator [Budvicia aquatica]
MIDTLDLQFLLAIKEHGSLVGAARFLNVTPSAVTQRLQQLEAKLDIHLIDRTARRLHFTDEGELLCRKGQTLLEQHKALLEEVMQQHGKLVGSLKINAPFGFGRKYLTPIITQFHRLYPQVEVLLKLSEQPLLEEQDRFDLVLHIGELYNSNLIVHAIAPNQRFICAAPALIEHYGMPSTPQALLNLPSIALQENNEDTTLWCFEQKSKKQTIRVIPSLSSNDGDVVCSWAKSGLGIIMRSQWDVADALSQGHLIRLLPEWTLPDAPVVALTHRRKGMPERVHAFMSLLKQQFSPQPPWQCR